jgi:S1-C subfamily serine protease
LVRISDRHDLALLKIDLPGPTQKIDLHDSDNTNQAGDTVTVLGYPTVPLIAAAYARSQGDFDPTEATVIEPILTVTGGLIGKVVHAETEPSGQSSAVYQLMMNATGFGNNGGPVFDDHGRVIGVFTSSSQAELVNYAVPIRFGRELMAITSSVN